MSDQDPYGQPPAVPPTPPATVAAPPQPPAPPPPPAAPAAPPQPPAAYGSAPPPAYEPPPSVPKKRKVWLIVAIAAVVLVCLPALCLGTFAVTAAREQAKTKEAVGIAEGHYDAATDALEQASELMGAFGDGGIETAADDAEAKIRSARDEIAAARAAIEPLDESDGKADYLASLDSATEALEGIEGLIGTLRMLSQLSGQITQGTASVRSADGLLDAAIDAGNDSKYGTMKSKAAAASGRYATASAIFTAAHKLEPTAGLDEVVAYVKLRKQQADLAVRMASDGQAGRISAYNKLVDRQQDLDNRAEKTGEPAIVTNPAWFEEKVAEQQSGFEAAGELADQKRLKALEELGYSAE